MQSEQALGSRGHFSREGNGTPLQYSCLENPMDGGAWWAAVHGVTKSQTQLSDFIFTFHFYALEKEMATHSSVLAWRIPGTGEPGGLPSMGSHRVGHDWSDLPAAAAGHFRAGPGPGMVPHRETERPAACARLATLLRNIVPISESISTLLKRVLNSPEAHPELSPFQALGGSGAVLLLRHELGALSQQPCHGCWGHLVAARDCWALQSWRALSAPCEQKHFHPGLYWAVFLATSVPRYGGQKCLDFSWWCLTLYDLVILQAVGALSSHWLSMPSVLFDKTQGNPPPWYGEEEKPY